MIPDWKEEGKICFQSSVDSSNRDEFRHTVEDALGNEWFAGRTSFI